MTTATITLTPCIVAEKALPLLEQKLLACQVYPGLRRYTYRTGETKAPCVIGAAIPDEIAEFLDRVFRGGSIDCGQQTVLYSEKDINWLREAQNLHDKGHTSELYSMLLEAYTIGDEGILRLWNPLW